MSTDNLGKASLDLEANLAPFEKNLKAGEKTADSMKDSLDALAAVANVAEAELNRVKMEASQGFKSREVADTIERSVGRVSAAAVDAADHLDRVKLGTAQATETTVVGDIIDNKLKDITGNANEARRAIESVKLASVAPGGGGGGGGVFDSNVGRFRGSNGQFIVGAGAAGGATGGGLFGGLGSSGGGIGLLPAAIAGGTLLAPSAGPALLGLLGAIPVLASSAVGAIGVLALAFDGVGKAIGGDKKAFDELNPSAQQFVLTIRSLSGWFDKLKETAASSLFPGLAAGLKSALSPGTLGAITMAIQQFGQAVGQAGATWGRYFGSAEFQSIFVPLMQAGARNLTLMSSAALALFDAFGVLGRAAIPFTTWLMQAIANGSKLADTWLHTKDASGGLSRAMDEAQVSLRLVGELLLSVGRAIGALGVALYPVSKIAVKDLTDGFNGLAVIIRRNQDVIREIIAGALGALVGAVKLTVDAIRLFNEGLSHIVGSKATIITAILAIGIALTIAFGPTSVAVTGVILAAGMIAQHWQTISDFIVRTIASIAGKIGDVLAFIPKWINPTLHNLGESLQNWATTTGANMGHGMGASFSEAFQGALNLKSLVAGGFTTDLLTGKPTKGAVPSGGPLSSKQIAALASAMGLDPEAVLAVAKMEGLGGGIGDGGHAFGPFQVNDAGGVITNKFPGWSQEQIQQWAWSKEGVNFALGGMAGVAKGLTGQAAVEAIVRQYERPKDPSKEIAGALSALGISTSTAGSPFGDPGAWTKNTPTPPKIITGANLIPQAINDRIAKFASIASNTAGKVAEAALEKEQKALLAARDSVTGKLKGATGEQRDAITAELTDLNGKLRDVHTAIKDNLAAQKKAVADAIAAVKSRFSGTISTLKSNVASMFSRIQADLDSALQAKFQQQIAALGAQFFQNGALTPTEQALANMQAEDARAAAYATGDPRQIAMYELGLQAAQERTQADKDYAAQVAVLQHQQQLEQQKLTDELARFSARVQNGTADLGDLNQVLKPFGLSIADIPADQLGYDMDNLSTATKTLAQVMLAEAVALAKLGDSKDAKSLGATAQSLLDNGFGSIADAGWNAGIAAALAAPHDSSDVISRLMGRIPKLDVGGTVAETGLAVVHEGETYSGVGGNRRDGGVIFEKGAIQGFVGNEAELAREIGRVLQIGNRGGLKYNLR